jgi:ribosomal-protein-alanine N-acetyltransferase
MMRADAERLYLRPLTEADCTPLYLSWLQDSNVNQFLETRHQPQTIEAIKEFVANVNARDDEHLFGICLKDGDRHIGNIKVGPVNRHHGIAEVSLLIGARDCWGKGYATDAIRAVSRHAFQTLKVRKLGAGMYLPNQGSCRAFEKVGYHKEGHRRSHYMFNGKPCDIVEYGLLPSELL